VSGATYAVLIDDGAVRNADGHALRNISVTAETFSWLPSRRFQNLGINLSEPQYGLAVERLDSQLVILGGETADGSANVTLLDTLRATDAKVGWGARTLCAGCGTEANRAEELWQEPSELGQWPTCSGGLVCTDGFEGGTLAAECPCPKCLGEPDLPLSTEGVLRVPVPAIVPRAYGADSGVQLDL
jgi:hypothetical protein